MYNLKGAARREEPIDGKVAVIGCAVVVTAVILAMIQPVWAEVATNNPGIFAVDSKAYGLTYGQWTAKWWQWAYSIPKDVNPIVDTSGKNCMEGQAGSVWLLAGTTGGPAERTCTIPAGKAILFPIINAECSYAEYPALTSDPQLRSCAVTQNDHVTLAASVDGVKIQGLQKYRVQSPLFSISAPQNNMVGIKGGTTTQGVSDGYWVFLQPLSAGKHDVHFSGQSVDYTSTGVNNYATDVTYHLTVQ
jgi:hypothetical protein